MKKILFLSALLPLAVFADGLYWVPNVFIYSEGILTGTKTQRKIATNDFISVQLAVAGVSHGARFDSRMGGIYPFGNAAVSTGQSILSYIQEVPSGLYVSGYQYGIINALDNICYQLWLSGFVSSNINHVVDSGFLSCFNINSLVAVSEALVSTNTSFRSAVLNGLSSLSSDVRQLVLNSASGLSSLSSLGSSLGSLADQYSLVNSFPYALKTNFIEAAGWWYTDAGLDNYDPWASIGNDLFDSQVNANGNENVFVDRFNALRGGYNSILQDAFKAYLTKSIADPHSVTNGEFESLLSNPAKAQEILSSSYSTPLTNALKKMTTDWKDAVTNQLAQNTANITNDLAQWKRDLKGHNDSVTNDLDKIGSAVANVERNTKGVADLLSGTSPNKAHVIVDNQELPVRVTNWPLDFEVSISANDLDVLARASSGSAKEILDALTNRVDALTNRVDGLPVSLDTITNLLAKIDVDMLDNLTNLDFNVSLTNELWNYYFTRFRRANEFEDENGQGFRVDSAASAIFDHGFDSGEFSNLNWFSRVEVLLYQVGRVFDSTNAIESVDIETALDDSVDQLDQHGADFVAASRRVVGLFGLIDRFAKSMKLAFGSYSNPVTSGILLLPSGSWIGNHALVLNIPVSVQNALRLVFQCIWYLSAFVVAWRVVSSAWSKVISFVRWLWSLVDV